MLNQGLRQPRPQRDDSAQGSAISSLLILPDVAVLRAGEYPPGEDRCGVYMLFDGDGAVNYVGQSAGVGYRVVQHLWAMRRGTRLPFVEYGFVEVPWLLLNGVEAAHIQALEPPENRARPPQAWRHHDVAVQLLQQAWGPKS